MPDDPKPKPVSVRLDPDVREGLDRVVTDERRSLNNAINVLLAEALAARAERTTE